MLENIFPYIGFISVAFWALSAIALRSGIARKDNALAGASVVALVTLLISTTPIGGLSFGSIVLSFIPVFSVGSILLAIVMSLKLWRGPVKDPLSSREWTVFLLAGSAYSLVLVLAALGILPFDLYAAGYGNKGLIAFHALCAIALALRGSPLTWWPVAACVLWLAGAVPSGNIHDLLTDVFFLAACMALLIKRLPIGLQSLRKPRSV